MNIFKRVLRIISYVFIAFAFFGLVLCCIHNDSLDVHRIETKNSKVDKTFKALVISDYHHRNLDFKNGNLITKAKEEEPDIVFFTGDMVDTHSKDLTDLEKIFDAFKDKPMFYVTGNHEQYAPLWTDGSVEKLMNKEKYNKNIHYLKNSWVDLEGTNIRIYGVDDPKFSNPNEPYFQKNYGNLKTVMHEFKNNGTWDSNKCNILLAHRPELMDLYSVTGFDYAICGHTHGGQVKLFNAWTPALIGQGLVPKYVAGEYKEDGTTMYVSKGLGYSAMLPIRVHCNPEILSITFSNN